MEAPRRDTPLETPGQCALSVTEANAEGDIETRVDGFAEGVATRTSHIALEQTAKCTVHDAVAFEESGTACARMCRVQQRDQTLVCILLRIPRQRPSGAPSCSE